MLFDQSAWHPHPFIRFILKGTDEIEKVPMPIWAPFVMYIPTDTHVHTHTHTLKPYELKMFPDEPLSIRWGLPHASIGAATHKNTHTHVHQ